MPFNLHSRSGNDISHLAQHLRKPSELSEVYISSAIFHFVSALTGLFVPLYFMNVIGFSLAQVLIFLAAISAIRAIWVFPTGVIISKIGPKHAMIASFPLAFLIYLFLFLLPEYRWLIVPIIFIEGFFVALYSSSFHVELSKGSHDQTRGKEVSRMLLWNAIALAAGPFLGAEIIQRFGFPALLILSMVLLVFAALPLLMSPEIYHKREFDFKKLNLKSIRRDLLGNMFENMEINAGVTIWAVFVYFFIGSYALVGGTRTAQLLVAAVATYFAGRFADKYDRGKLLTIGAVSSSIIEVVRIFMRHTVGIIIVDILRGLTIPFRSIPFVSLYYRHADENPRMEYIAAVECAGGMAVAVLMTLGALVNLAFGNLPSLIFILAVGAVSAFMVKINR